MDKQFDILLKSRKLVLKLIDGYTLEQLNKIPEGFGNNIIWNVAHLVVTQQLLCYKFSGVPLLVSDEMIGRYMKGTAPKESVSSEEFEKIKKIFLELPLQFEKDFKLGVFKTYQPYTTSADVTLTDINAAAAFNNFHEGIHLGVILALRKVV